MNIFITGTDTDVGKTVVASWICMHSKKAYWKPIQTGADSDSATIKELSPQTVIISETYKLKKPLSPYNAANFENKEININDFQTASNVVIEGAGGVLVPITSNFYMADLIKLTKSQAIIVAKSRLGFLNHIFLTIEALRTRNTPIIGIILNGETENLLIDTIEKFSGIKVLTIIPYSNTLQQTLEKIDLPPELR